MSLIEHDEFIDPRANPDRANALVASVLNEASAAREPEPTIASPADDIVRLPGGIVQEEFGAPDTLVAREVQVRELTGADEEQIARIQMSSNNGARLPQAIVRCGVASINGEKPSPDLLRNLLVGDQEAIIMGIRRVTYGDEIEMETRTCPHCGEEYDATLSLSDIPMRTLKDPIEDRRFDVPMRKGGYATVRLPNVEDFEAAMDAANTTVAQQNTAILTGCIQSITRPDGMTDVVAGNRALVAAIGVADRRSILREVQQRQPGPQFGEVKYTHSCGREVEVFLSQGDLFRDL